ncbi:hypothetical protein HS7_04840 [Sulfolobales archaeon HS-7]|nr:hypothetical protein HS7_04840 [Sulfolobales archaeon HS-7]
MDIILTARQLEKVIIQFSHAEKEAELIVVRDLIEELPRMAMKYGVSLIDAEDINDKVIRVKLEKRFW